MVVDVRKAVCRNVTRLVCLYVAQFRKCFIRLFSLPTAYILLPGFLGPNITDLRPRGGSCARRRGCCVCALATAIPCRRAGHAARRTSARTVGPRLASGWPQKDRPRTLAPHVCICICISVCVRVRVRIRARHEIGGTVSSSVAIAEPRPRASERRALACTVVGSTPILRALELKVPNAERAHRWIARVCARLGSH